MGILGKDKLLELIENYKCIYPFDLNLLDGDSYVLTVKEERTLQYHEHKKTLYSTRLFSRLQTMWLTLRLKANMAEQDCPS